MKKKNGTRKRKEVVFLPYKASMWDSLEGVWREMSARADVKTIVIPIPYYDRNPDGSFGEVHFEFDQYPPEVEVTDFREYDLEVRHPAAIYIHNPYDDQNYVTSVDPMFYSKRLKACTDELVYIPYFVLAEIYPGDRAAYEASKKFIAVPAVIHATRVIVQSMAWRQAYVEVMTQMAGENSRAYWENKIEGTGSPKIDRADSLTERDYEIPDEWKEKIFRADGSKKKVIFYNTSVSALLQSDELMLDKIERNLDLFKEWQDDVVLLWRPHPLYEATLNSLRQGFLDRYHGIVERYLEEDLGIFDDSSELYRAIAVSDAYYGDESSVVQLYKETKKPIMIQNVHV